jgi:hypothetical protein
MENKNGYATGGGLLLGIGIGFFFLPDVFAFVGSLMAGLGLGLIIEYILANKK